jgi:hypothetical protein
VKRDIEFHSCAQRIANNDERGAAGVDSFFKQRGNGTIATRTRTAPGSDVAEGGETVEKAILRRYPRKQLESRLAYFQRKEADEPDNKLRAQYQKEITKTQKALNSLAANAAKEMSPSAPGTMPGNRLK